MNTYIWTKERYIVYDAVEAFPICTISEFSNISNFLSFDLSRALATIDFANIATETDCFDEVSNLAAKDCPHLSNNLDSPSLEKFSVINNPGL